MSPKLSKTYPQCSAVVRKSVCIYGYKFVTKRVVAKTFAMRCVRAAESEVEASLRKASDRQSKIRNRALETECVSVPCTQIEG